ncbi:MAG: hypothetical protein A4E30_00256 [Methanomassiliicoccales archaeon PtaB.Bin215]|nr:MAG: hypothetical protein A4E30_00256 [Methanomassiliicoccales archaeon PtaB.Bin215]
MTSEILIMNKRAVALAADSAVTMGDPNHRHKIFTSSDKIFKLTKNNPIGIMIYNKNEFMGIPLEVAIKNYYDKCDKVFPTLHECAEDFLHYLRDFKVSEEMEDLSLLMMIHSITKRIIDSIHDEDAKLDYVSIIRRKLDGLEETEYFVEDPEDHISIIKQEHRDLFQRCYDSLFDAEEPIDPEVKELLMQYIPRALIEKDGRFGFSKTGLVITGYGSDDFFPRVTEVELDGRVCGSLRIWKCRADAVGDIKITRDDEGIQSIKGIEASLKAYAQQDMVHVFLDGISDGMERSVNSFIVTILKDVIDMIFQKIGEEEHSDLRSELVQIVDETVRQQIREVLVKMKKDNSRPMVKTISIMDKQELAVMAKTMVSLTAFKRKVSPEPETVGGPIDVAIITKSDGFVWVEKKEVIGKNL